MRHGQSVNISLYYFPAISLTVFFIFLMYLEKSTIFVIRRFSNHQSVLLRGGMSRWGTSYVGFFLQSLSTYSYSTELGLNMENKL